MYIYVYIYIYIYIHIYIYVNIYIYMYIWEIAESEISGIQLFELISLCPSPFYTLVKYPARLLLH